MGASGGRWRSGWSNARGSELGDVVACCQEEDCCCVIVTKPQRLSSISPHSARWQMSEGGELAVWHMCDIALCAAWKKEGEEVTAIMI